MYFKEMPPKERTLQVLQDELIGKHLEFRALPVQTWKGLVWQEVPTGADWATLAPPLPTLIWQPGLLGL